MREEGSVMTDVASTEYAEFAHELFRAQADQVAADLRKIADRINRAIIADSDGVSGPRHAACASEIVQDVIWGFANLHLDRLTLSAATADVAAHTTEVTS
jgi:hypothetical protein